ncbi:hypothetical protein PG985_008618 [Apiospora marii]|uniref:Uncharacterized protein n=1 Tax=Apiospora marii TaxID=335849 RepID=A0ABR1R2Z2_9PEZI
MQFFTTALAALSMSSVFAAPVAEPRADNAVSTVFNTVADVKLTVTDELSTVTKLVGDLKNTVVGDVVQKKTVATVQRTLSNVETELHGVLGLVLGTVTNTVVPLVGEELDNVPVLLKDVKAIVEKVKVTVTGVVGEVTDDVLVTLKPELKLVLSLVNTLVTPVVQLATGLVGEVTGGVVPEVTSLVGDVEGLAGGLLSPSPVVSSERFCKRQNNVVMQKL